VYIAESLGVPEVSNYFSQIVKMNDFTRRRFAENIVRSMFDNAMNKRIAILGFAFKADTGDTRETNAITIVDFLLHEGAITAIYDPMVPKGQMIYDLQANDSGVTDKVIAKQFVFAGSAYEAAAEAHAIVLLTEWREFLTLDYQRLYDSMIKPAFFFDGRNLIDRNLLRRIGYCTFGIGVPPDVLP
jgi:UDPglucose 6-dehydrogenase